MAATCSPDIYETIINFGLWELFKRERNLLTEKHLEWRIRGARIHKAIMSLVYHFFLLGKESREEPCRARNQEREEEG